MINDCLYITPGRGPVDMADVLLASPCAESGHGFAWGNGDVGTTPLWRFPEAKPTSSGVSAHPDLAPAKDLATWGLRMRGVLTIPKDGAYRIRVSNGTKALRLTIGGTVLCNVPGPGLEAREVVLDLKAGPVALNLAYAVAEPGFTELKLEWAGPDFTLRAIPDDAFTH